MIASVSIPIDDHDTGSPMICTQYYITEIRLAGQSGWNRMQPNTLEPPIIVGNLGINLTYDYRIARVCCNGAQSDWTQGTFNTIVE